MLCCLRLAWVGCGNCRLARYNVVVLAVSTELGHVRVCMIHLQPFSSSLSFFSFFPSRHFAQWEVDEEKVVESWIAHMDTDRDVRELGAVKK